MYSFEFKKNKGFTLIELLAVVSIIGVLILISYPKYKTSITKARLITFEHNSKILMSRCNTAYSNAGADISKINETLLNKEVKKMNNKAHNEEYSYKNGILTCKYENYIITYDVTTSKISQKIPLEFQEFAVKLEN